MTRHTLWTLGTAGLTAALLIGCMKGASEVAGEATPAPELSARPSYTTADEPDDVSAHSGETIVVDFVDGTTKADFDAIEKAWGVDLELNDTAEGPDSAITLGALPAGVDLNTLLATIRADSHVEAAEPLMKLTSSGFTPNDPLYGQQWNMRMIHMPEAWEKSTGKGVVVAVLDTGIAYEDYDDFRQVPDLKGAKFVDGYDFVNDDGHANDDHGHGTHVAGTIAQVTNNSEGVAGVAYQASLMPVKVLDAFGSGNSADIADAIRWASDHGAKVINMSLGGGGRSAVLENAVEYARAHGTVVVCAAGNGGRGIVEFPAAYPGSVAVGAVGPTGAKAPYSSWGKELDIAAPGGDKSQGNEAGIVQNTIDPKDPSKAIYASYNGTSMATPHVAGIAALLFSAGAKNPDQVEKALFASAVPPQGVKGWSEQFGHGIVDADAALKALNGKAVADTVQPETPVASVSYGALDWKPALWAAALLAFVLLTLGRKERPGFLNVLFTPGFIIPVVVATLGIFVVRAIAPANEMTTSLVLPLPDWLNRIIFGRGAVANPIIYSALIPIVTSLFAISMKGFRPVAGGIAIGFAAILAYTVWAGAPGLAWLPLKVMAIPWLVVNAFVCLFVARAMLRREKA